MFRHLVRPKPALGCSFCGKSSDQVARLISGPEVYICDACVRVCNRTLAITDALESDEPQPAAEVEQETDALLHALNLAEAQVEKARGDLQARVDELRRREVSWLAIGAALGVSRQAAWDRFS